MRLRGVRQAYRQGDTRVTVLDGVAEDFAPGEFVVLLGRSGSGKTTLLNLLAGLQRPDAGQIEVAGAAVHALDEAGAARLRRESLGIVFQAWNLVPTLSAAENVALPLTLNGQALPAAMQAAAEALDAVGLRAAADRMPDRLSGGEQQRVAIARAMVHRPRVLLADEPTGQLDLDTARDVVDRLQTLVRLHGSALIMATHSLEVAGRADRVLRLTGGRLQPA